tara:strand:+ start:1259 stop:2233 length:975 start_codon:yes stop_codon:yes gene_type:complete
MSFFNKKEDVIKIELTPHGRKLLSEGKLKPEYYSFFDDDILYDSGRGGFSETNSQSKTRILTETPSMRPQTTHRGVDTGLKSSLTIDKNDSMVYAIGTNKYSEQKGAAWEAFILQGEVDTITYNYTTVTNENIKIPQVNCLLNYTMSVDNVLDNPLPESDFLFYEDNIADDGTFIKITQDELLVYLSEVNGFSTHDSFTIDAFIYEDDKKEFKQLNFLSNKATEDYIENDLLKPNRSGVDSEVLDQPQEFITPMTVDFYFDLSLDDAVDRLKICQGIKFLKTQDIYTGLQDYDCEDILAKETDLGIDIYQNGLGQDDLEVCEDE